MQPKRDLDLILGLIWVQQWNQQPSDLCILQRREENVRPRCAARQPREGRERRRRAEPEHCAGRRRGNWALKVEGGWKEEAGKG